MKIEAKVAKVLDGDGVVLNRGTNHGVDIGMVFEIGDDRLLGIKDPDTGEDLGEIRGDRVALEIVRIGPKASLAIAYRAAGDLSVGLLPWSMRDLGPLEADAWRRIDVGDVATYKGRRANRLY